MYSLKPLKCININARLSIKIEVKKVGLEMTLEFTDVCNVPNVYWQRVPNRWTSHWKHAISLVFSARHSKHITLLLHYVHWVRFPERTRLCLCVLTYCCHNGTALSYLAQGTCWVPDVDSHRHFHSSATTTNVNTHHRPWNLAHLLCQN